METEPTIQTGSDNGAKPAEPEETFAYADDLFRRLESIDEAQDRHRREMMLLWIACLLNAGLLTLILWQRVRSADA